LDPLIKSQLLRIMRRGYSPAALLRNYNVHCCAPTNPNGVSAIGLLTSIPVAEDSLGNQSFLTSSHERITSLDRK
jgi:hypothetical protein